MTEPVSPSTVETPTPSTVVEQVPASTEQGAPSAPAKPEWWAALEAADAKELAKHPTVSGLVGTLAERQAKKAVEKALAERDVADRTAAAEREAMADKQRLDQLRDNDPYNFAAEVRQREQAALTAKMQADKQLSELQQSARDLIQDLGLTDEDVADLQAKTWPGSPLEGFRAFSREINNRATTRKAEKLAEQQLTAREAEIAKAVRAQVLAELNGGEPAPDLGTGRVAAAPKLQQVGTMKQADYEKLGKTTKERMAALGYR